MSVPVSGLQEAVEKLDLVSDEIFRTLTPPSERSEISYVLARVAVSPILLRFARAAQVSALESVAKQACGICHGNTAAGMIHNPVAERCPAGGGGGTDVGEGEWSHEVRNVGGSGRWFVLCACPEVHDALSRLRSEAGSGSEPEKEPAK